MVGFLFYELVGRSFQQVSCQRIYFLYLKQNQVITQSVGCNPIVRIFGRSKYRPALVLGDAKGLAPNFKNRPRAKGAQRSARDMHRQPAVHWHATCC